MYNKFLDNDDEDDPELLSLALVPLSYNGSSLRITKSQSAVSSPLNVTSSLGGGILTSTLSCPSTPQMPRRRYMREGATQLTSLTTLCTHHRYLFLFNDLLLVSKQKYVNILFFCLIKNLNVIMCFDFYFKIEKNIYVYSKT